MIAGQNAAGGEEPQRPGKSTDAERLLGAVLAGGKSTRMGRDKALLRRAAGDADAGRAEITFLDHAVQRLLPLTRHVVVLGRTIPAGHVAAAEASALPPVIGLPDRKPSLGPAMGVATALRFAADRGFDAVLVTPVDMPDLTAEHLRLLIGGWQDRGGPTAAAFRDNMPEPLLAIYPTSLADSIGTLADSADRSLFRWLSRQEVSLVPLPIEAAKNVNRPSDLDDESSIA